MPGRAAAATRGFFTPATASSLSERKSAIAAFEVGALTSVACCKCRLRKRS